MTQGHRGSLLLRCRTFSCPFFSRVAPVHCCTGAPSGPRMRVSHARGPSKPQRAVQHRLEVLRRIRRASIGGPPVRSRGVQLALRFRHLFRSASKAHLPTSAPLRARAPGSLSGQLCEHLPGGARPCGARFPAAFQRRNSLSWAPCPATGFSPSTIGLPPRLRIPVPARRTLARFTRSARMRPDRPGSLLPRGQRSHRPSRHPRPSPAASQRRSLPPRRHNPARDVIMTRHQQEFPGSGPTGPSPHCGRHGWGGVLGLSRELRTQPIRTRPRTSRRGQAEHNL